MRPSLRETVWASVVLLAAASIQAQSTLQIRPELITQCAANGLGRATLTWNSPGPGQVQVRVSSPQGPALTGPADPKGSAETGDWITDNTVFVLVDVAASRELARVTARLACAPFDQQAPAALAAGAYLPLQVGNQWLYRVNDRQVTSHYFEWLISRAELINGKAWFVVSRAFTDGLDSATEIRLRNDDKGRVLMLTPQGQEAVWLDPTTPADPSALYTIESRAPFQNALGSFADALYYSTRSTLILERGAFARGIGLVAYSRTMLTGSSGGFTDGGDLVYARVGGKLIFTTPAVSFELSAESNVVKLSEGRVTNCAVPSYCVACFLIGADPPGTYKPCFQARLHLQMATPATINLELLNSSGQAIFQTSLPVSLSIDAPEAVLFRQIPLYSAPNQPFPVGLYRLRATVLDGNSQQVASSVVAIRLE